MIANRKLTWLMEKLSASQIREALKLLPDFALNTDNEEIQHIAIKASKTAELELTRTTQQSNITFCFV